MKIGIIGAGNTGSALAGHFQKLRLSVLIANSQGPKRCRRSLKKTGATPVDTSEMAGGIDLLVVAIPMKSMPSLLKNLLADLPTSSPAFSRILETSAISRLEERRRDTAHKLNPTQTIGEESI